MVSFEFNLNDAKKAWHEEAMEQGLEQGLEQGRLQSLLGYIKKKKFSVEEALEDLDIPSADRSKYALQLKNVLDI